MSDTPQAPGWWQASDGKWYPPQSQQAPPPPKKGGGCLKAMGLAALGFVGLIVLIAVVAAAGGGKKASEDSPAQATRLFPGRPDAQPDDQERNIGESARLSGYTATAMNAGFEQKLSEFEDEGYVWADVKIENRDDRAQPYNVFDWKLQTPGGQVINPTITSKPQLGSGDLVPGGNVTGQVIFEVGAAQGDFFLIYKPGAFDADRGVWKVTV
jgi:hypothetical protein